MRRSPVYRKVLGLCASALFLPFFDYGDVIWGDRGNTTLMAELQVLHNKAARSILDLLARPSLGRLRWKPLQRQKAEERHIFTYKYINNLFMHSGQCLIVVFIIIILDLSSLRSGPVTLPVKVLPAKSIVSDTGMFVKRLVTS